VEKKSKGEDIDMNEERKPSPAFWKKRLWRLVFWTLGTFLLVSLGLLALSLPDLTRKVAPPVISGSHPFEKTPQNGEVSRPDENGETPRTDDTPTSRTVLVDASGQEILNLRDFPHLSPTMRYLAEEWFVAWKELEKIAEVDSDLATRTLIQEKMQRLVEGMKRYLDLPLAWKNDTHYDFIFKMTEIGEKNSLNLEVLSTFCRINEVGTPGEWARLKSIHDDMNNRIQSELAIRHGMWGAAVDDLYRINSGYEKSYDSRTVTRQCWEDELFCWRQMGLAGQMGLVARSCEERFLPQVETPTFRRHLMHMPAVAVWGLARELSQKKNRPSPPASKEPTPTEP